MCDLGVGLGLLLSPSSSPINVCGTFILKSLSYIILCRAFYLNILKRKYLHYLYELLFFLLNGTKYKTVKKIKIYKYISHNIYYL